MKMHQNLPASCCNFIGSDVLLIRISNKFALDLCVTFLNFQASSIWEDVVNVIALHKLPVSSCNLIVVFSTLNFQADSFWKDLVNMITLHKLLISSCSLTVVFSRLKSLTSSMLIFV